MTNRELFKISNMAMDLLNLIEDHDYHCGFALGKKGDEARKKFLDDLFELGHTADAEAMMNDQ
jgi:hypothetical protein